MYKGYANVRDYYECYHSEARQRTLVVLGFSPNSLWKFPQPQARPPGEGVGGALGCDLPAPPGHPLRAKPRWLEKPHQPAITNPRARSCSCATLCPLLPSSSVQHFSFAPGGAPGQGARGLGPWCSLAGLVLGLLVWMALHSQAESCLLLPRCGRS